MCPDSSCIIDTTKPFTHSISFEESNGQLTAISNTLSQEGRNFNYNACSDSGYLTNMSKPLDAGMVMVLSQWGNTYERMKWLDSMTGCTGDCDIDGAVITFSNISIESL